MPVAIVMEMLVCWFLVSLIFLVLPEMFHKLLGDFSDFFSDIHIPLKDELL